MYGLGEGVLFQREGRAEVGEVVGVRAVGSLALYDVSFEEVTLKALAEGELEPAPNQVVEGLLSQLVTAPVRDVRTQVLRQAYLESLLRMISGHGADELPDNPLFTPGDAVALQEGETEMLATVLGAAARDGRTSMVVEALGERREVPEDSVRALEPHTVLGMRARFAVAGRETDGDYEGTVCAVTSRGGCMRFSLMFDDGDILEGLGESDLCLLHQSSDHISS